MTEERQGFVYFIAAGKATKVGWSTAPEKRLRYLQTGNPETMLLLAKIPGTRKDERATHKSLKRAQLNDSEWFRTPTVLTYLAARGIDTVLDRRKESDTAQTLEKEKVA